MSSAIFTPPEILPCSRCEVRDLQFDALDLATKSYVYACECGSTRNFTRPELDEYIRIFGNVGDRPSR